MVSEPQDLKKAIELAFNESNEVLIETMMQGTEVSCGVVKTKGFEMVLPVTEIRSKNAFFDYEAKYSPGVSDEITPAQIPTDVYDKVQKMSSGIYDLLGCSGIVRVDFIIVNDLPMFLEINTVPGMTAESILPKQIAASGMEAADLYSKIIEDLF
jgi:D-alanine-D-alanine ligase